MNSSFHLWVEMLMNLIIYLIGTLTRKEVQENIFIYGWKQPYEKGLILQDLSLIFLRYNIANLITFRNEHGWDLRIGHNFVEFMWECNTFHLLIPKQEIFPWSLMETFGTKVLILPKKTCWVVANCDACGELVGDFSRSIIDNVPLNSMCRTNW